MRAPFASYVVKDFLATGLAGGGALTMRINMDPKFCSLISFLSMGIQQGTATDTDNRIVVSATDPIVPSFQENFVMVATSLTVSVIGCARTFNPPPQVLPGNGVPFIRWQALNIAGDLYTLNAQIMLFNIDVRQKMPMGPLLWARGST